MTDPTRDVADLRVADLLTFLAVVRSSSLTAAARERRVTPSQVSKAITRVETLARVFRHVATIVIFIVAVIIEPIRH